MVWTPDQRTKELDRMKSSIFLHKGEGHLASILCTINTVWAEDAVTIYTNGLHIGMNQKFIEALPKESRETVLAAKLWNIAMLHLPRGIGKDMHLWAMACSYWVNNHLHNKGYSFAGLKPWLDHRYDDYAVDEIYEDLIQRQANDTLDDLDCIWGYTDDDGMGDTIDLRHPHATDYEVGSSYPPLDPLITQQMNAAVVQAAQYAAQEGGGVAGAQPMLDMMNQFLAPKVKWEKEVLPWMIEQEGLDYNWAIPNRRIRIPGVYLPSLHKGSEGGLTHIAFFGDSSGSITIAQGVRINSEAHYIKKRFNPELFTMINFDDAIQMEKTFKRTDRFDEIEFVGRGGTDLTCVRNWIIEHKPKAAVIFTDYGCEPWEKLPPGINTSILWIIFNNPTVDVPEGRIVHVNE